MYFRLILLGLGLVALAGCPKPLALRTYPAPTATELFEHVQRGHGALSAVRARAKADLSDDSGGRVKIDLGLLVRRPDQLRVAGENALAGPLMTLATDGQSYQLIDLRNGRFSSGQVNPCSMSRLLRVAMPPTAAVDVLLGSAPLLAGAELSPQVLWDGSQGGLEVLTLRDGTGRTEILKLQLVGKAWDLRQAEGLDASGRLVWRVRHEGHVEVPLAQQQVSEGSQPRTVRLPKVTHIEDLTHKSDVRLRWRERELDPTLEPELFRLEQPPGIPVEPDLCGGGVMPAP